MRTIVAYVAASLTFVVLDILWLGYIAYSFYRNELGPLLADPFNLPAAFAFYLLFMAGLLYFAISPAVESGDALKALVNGALFGLFCYATYDLTNLATLKGFSTKLAIADMAWGTLVSGISAFAGAKAALYLSS